MFKCIITYFSSNPIFPFSLMSSIVHIFFTVVFFSTSLLVSSSLLIISLCVKMCILFLRKPMESSGKIYNSIPGCFKQLYTRKGFSSSVWPSILSLSMEYKYCIYPPFLTTTNRSPGAFICLAEMRKISIVTEVTDVLVVQQLPQKQGGTH